MSLRCVLIFSASVGLLLAVQESPTGNPRPSAQQQSAMLAAMGRFAQQYVSNLPNFICLQTIEQYQGNKKGEHWKKGDTLAMRLAYSERQEHRTIEQVNNKPVENRNRGWKHPMRTEGEFGPLLANVFSDASNASFEWSRWDTLNGRRVAVFAYKIDKEHSQTKLGDTYVHDVTVATEGLVFADPETGEVFKITSDVSD